MKIFKPAEFGCGVRIVTTGAYLPERVVSNADLVAMGAPLDAEEMVRLSGIKFRRWVAENQATSDLAIAAGRQALACAGDLAVSLERLVVATVSSDYSSPSTACLVHAGLGLPRLPVFDLTASCAGFLYALDAAARAVATGDRAVLAIAADVRSRYLDVTDRATCALFGDGAGAALLAPAPPNQGLIAIGLSADGTGAHSIYVPAGGSREAASPETVATRRHCIRMQDGPQIYLSAVEGMLLAARELLDSVSLTFKDIDWLIPHQANMHILKRIAWKAGLPLEKVICNIETVGNISGATVAVAMDEALRAKRLKAGDRVLLLAAGAGYTAGAALYVVDEDLLANVGCGANI